MPKKKQIQIHNKSDRPDNIVLKEHETIELCLELEKQLPSFFYDFFLYLKNAVALSTRLAYLQDIQFFCRYLVQETKLTSATSIVEITPDDFSKIAARDINRFIGDYCARYRVENENQVKIIENRNRSLSRKKSTLSVLFKFLYREEIIKSNITEGFNPIRMPKPQPDAIKRLEIDEVAKLLDLTQSGEAFSEKEKSYWEKTKYRDRAILMLFVTYGLRLSELQQLNLSSFNFNRGEFKIYRKRGKEVLMPTNLSCEKVIKEYLELERLVPDADDQDSQDALFLSLQRRRMTTRAIRNLVKKYTAPVLNTSQEHGYSPHKLRATAATSLIQQGFSIYDVQNLLDHDNVTTTQLYAAHKKDVKREIIKNFEWLDK